LRRETQKSIYPAQVLTPDQQLRTSVKTIAARQLALVEEGMARGSELTDPQTVARFLKDVTVAMKTVQDMERNEAADLTGLTDEELEQELAEAEQREASANKRLMDVLPRSVKEREE